VIDKKITEFTEEQVTAGAMAMVRLCQEHRAKGELMPSRRAEARACLEAALAVRP
jgi:hypothetical protein